MKTLLSAVVLLLISTQSFAESVSLQDMREQVQTIKSTWIDIECAKIEDKSSGRSALKQMLIGVAPQCTGTQTKKLLAACAEKHALVADLETVLLDQNIQMASWRMGGNPPADALGGVLLWQMRKSIEQRVQEWSTRVNHMYHKTQLRVKCLSKAEANAEFADYANYVKSVLSQTTLLVDTPRM